MKYFVNRGGQQSGPYSLSDLQNMSAQGTLNPYDLAWSEELPVWTPVFLVLGNPQAPPSQPAGAPIPAAGPPTYPAAAPPYPAAAPPYPASAPTYPAGAPAWPAAPLGSPSAGPVPPSFPWVLVLVFHIMTFGIFGWVWMFKESTFVKKIDPKSNGTVLWSIFLALYVFAMILVFGGSASGDSDVVGYGTFCMLPALALFIIGGFSIRKSLLTYYNSVENINLRLNGALTFFFSIFYFQYHLSRIADWKRTGVLVPQ